MKPLLVLSLVAAAITALFFVMLSSPSDPQTSGKSITRTELRKEKAPKPELQPISLPTPPTPQPKPASSERVAIEGDGNESFEGAYSNGLRGSILTPDSSPLAGAKVTITDNALSNGFAPLQALVVAQGGERPATWSTITDAEGRFEFASLPPSSSFSAKARHEEFGQALVNNIQVTASGFAEVTLRMKLGFELRGYVLDDVSGAPVVGAELSLRSIFSSLAGTSNANQLTAVSDEKGNYRFLNVPAGTRSLTVKAMSYGSRTRNNLLFAGTPGAPINQDFRLAPGLCLRGRVIAPDMTALAGARINATSYETAQVSRGDAISDKDGYFEICDLSEGTYIVLAKAEGFSDQRLTRIKLTDPEIQIVMARQGGVMGTVVAAADKSPITQFVAKVRSVAPGSALYGRTLTTGKFNNPDGSFDLGGLETGSYAVQIESAGYAPAYSETFVVSQGIVTPDIRIKLGQGGSITGRLLDRITGQPVQGALVSTVDNNYVPNQLTQMLSGLVPRTTTARKVRSKKDGSFKIKLITSATYQLQIDHPNYTQISLKDLRITEGLTQELGSIRMAKGATVRGIVYDAAGKPLAGARIALAGSGHYPNTIHTDSEGHYVLNNVKAGTWTLSAIRPASDTSGGPFMSLVDMRNSEVIISVNDGQEIVRNMSIGR